MFSISNHALSAINSGLGVVFNLCLLPLIITKSSPMMGSYKYLLFLYTLQSVVWGAICYFITPQVYAAKGYFVCFSGSGYFNVFEGTLILMGYAFCWIQIVSIVTLCFLQRYLTLIESPQRDWFTKKYKICLIVLIDLLMTAVIELIMVWGYWPAEYKNRIMGEDFKKVTGFDIEKTPYIGAPDWIDGELHIKGVFVSGFFGLYATLASIIIGVIIVRMVRIFSNLLKHMRTRRLEYQTRIFLLLLVQTFFPVVFNFGPAIMGHFGGILRIDLGSGIAAFCSLISLAQCIDPIATFFFVTEYRDAVLGFFKSRPLNLLRFIRAMIRLQLLSRNPINRSRFLENEFEDRESISIVHRCFVSLYCILFLDDLDSEQNYVNLGLFASSLLVFILASIGKYKLHTADDREAASSYHAFSFVFTLIKGLTWVMVFLGMFHSFEVEISLRTYISWEVMIIWFLTIICEVGMETSIRPPKQHLRQEEPFEMRYGRQIDIRRYGVGYSVRGRRYQ